MIMEKTEAGIYSQVGMKQFRSCCLQNSWFHLLQEEEQRDGMMCEKPERMRNLRAFMVQNGNNGTSGKQWKKSGQWCGKSVQN